MLQFYYCSGESVLRIELVRINTNEHNYVKAYQVAKGMKKFMVKLICLLKERQSFWLMRFLKILPIICSVFCYSRLLSFGVSEPNCQILDLYADLVAGYLKCSMSVETWQHGKKDNLPSSCSSKYHVSAATTQFWIDSCLFAL